MEYTCRDEVPRPCVNSMPQKQSDKQDSHDTFWYHISYVKYVLDTYFH